MKKIFSSLLALLFLVAQAQAQTITAVIEGTVTQEATGAPVSDWFVWAYSTDTTQIQFDPHGNPIFGIGFGVAVTDVDGYYRIEMELPVASTEIIASTQTTCFDPADPNAGVLSQTKNLVNGQTQADFVVCNDLPPTPDCWAYGWYVPAGGLAVQFNGEAYGLDSLETYTYVWDFGDGTTSTEQNPVHTYPAEGDYIANLTATSASGCVSTTQIWVTVYEPFSGPTDTVTVSGYIYNVVDSLPVPGWWVTSLGVDPWFPAFGFTDDTGYYTIQIVIPEGQTEVLVETYDCSGFAIAQNVQLTNGTGTADFYICNDQPPIPGCYAYIKYYPIDSLTYQFHADFWSNTDPNGAAVSYLWDFGDGNTSTEAAPEHTYATDGVYTVMLTAIDSTGCESHACEIVCTMGGGVIDTFWYGCQAMFWVGIDPTTTGNTVQFYDASFGAIATWAWDFGDGATSTEQNPIHTYNEEGVYTVTLNTTTVDGCESTILMDIWVGHNAWNEWNCQAMFLPIPDGTGTGFYFLDASSSPTPITSWTWNFGDGNTSTEQNPFHVYAQPGVYNVSLTIEADSCSSVFSFDLDTERPLLFNPEDSNLPALGLSGSVSKTTEKPAFEGLKLFPNPASTDLTLAFDSRVDTDFELRITDLMGKALAATQHKANAGTNAVRADVSRLPQGFYLAQIVAPKGTQTVKFTKQ